MKTVNQMAKEIYEWRINKGFYTPASLDTLEQRDAMLGKLNLIQVL